MTYFEFYGIPVSFQVDEPALKKQYYANSKKFHPDFHSLESEEKQQWALEQSTLNNQAYITLSDPDKRMEYVLELKALPTATLPPDFLMEMMDINEAIMDLQMDFDAERWQSTINQVQDIDNQLLKSVEHTLKTYTDNGENETDLKNVQNYFLKKKYLLRIKENLSTFAPA
jgi:molecular chaperone HscB